MSLFFKIFLWFWGAMTVLISSLILILATLPDESPTRSTSMTSFVSRYSTKAVNVFLDGGDSELRQFLRETEKENGSGIKMYLFDWNGRARGLKEGTQASDEVRDLALRALDSMHNPGGGEIQFGYSAFRFTVAQPIPSRKGTVVFIGSISRSLLSLRLINSISLRTKILSLFLVFLTSGLFCYGLTRYFATPLSRVRVAAQRLAEGDLSARVEPNHIPRGNDEITQLAHDFDQMAERLQTLVNAQNRLLGDVSHELRSPLARMNLALELARRGDEVKRQNAIERIERESSRLDTLIGQLLTLSRLENGLRAESLNTATDIAALVRNVATDAEFESHNAGRGVQVTFTGPEKGLIMRGDPELLHRAVENVTRNALRHTLNDSTVALELKVDTHDVIITVSDGGPGVPSDELESIFRPFYRVEGARDRPDGGSGTGLGLAIAQRAIYAHGGTISASNREEGGLKVRLSLPKSRIISKNEKALVTA